MRIVCAAWWKATDWPLIFSVERCGAKFTEDVELGSEMMRTKKKEKVSRNISIPLTLIKPHWAFRHSHIVKQCQSVETSWNLISFCSAFSSCFKSSQLDSIWSYVRTGVVAGKKEAGKTSCWKRSRSVGKRKHMKQWQQIQLLLCSTTCIAAATSRFTQRWL